VADFVDPYAVMATNPYMLPQAEKPHWSSVLGNLMLGAGAGISQANSMGRGWGAGVAPGLLMGMNLVGNQQRQAQEQAMRQAQFAQMSEYRRAQMANAQSALKLKEDAAKRDAAMGDQIAGLVGFNVPSAPAVQMGPDFQNAGKSKVEYLTGTHGLSPVAAAGVVGNLYQESGFNPTAVGDGGTAHGLAQWRGDRHAGLVNFAKAQGKPPTDPNVQMDYLVTEMKGGDIGAQRAYAMLQTAKTPQDATTAMMHFVRPAGYTPSNPTAGHGFQNRVQYAQALLPNGQPVSQGEGGPPGSPADATAPSGVAGLPPEVRGAIATVARSDPKAAATMLVNALQNQKKEDAYTTLTPESAKMFGLDPTKSWQMNKVTRKIEPIGGVSTEVKIDQRGEDEFRKKMGAMDAERFGNIIAAEGKLNDTASKIGFAMDQFRQTYTGPGAEAAQKLNEIFGAVGFEGAAKKATAAEAGMAVISELKPQMRVAGSGTSTDKDMDVFGKALPGLMNLPGGNEKVAAYFQRLADRATRIRELAQEHSEGGKIPLTRTPFDAEVKKLGPLFSEDELKEMREAGKAKPKAAVPSSLDAEIERRGLNKPKMSPAPSGSPLEQELKRRGF
jgi:hypothetical protein